MENPLQRKIQIDRDLTALLGLIEFGLIDKGRKLKSKNFLNQLTSFNTYIIHCDLIDRDENLFNGNKRGEAPISSIVVVFDIIGKPFKRVSYQSEETVRRNSPSQINSVNIKATDY